MSRSNVRKGRRAPVGRGTGGLGLRCAQAYASPLLLILFACAPAAQAQRTVTRITDAEADARILERTIDIEIAADGSMTRTDRRLLEMLTHSALDTYGDPIIVHDAGRQEMTVQTARTTDPDGSVQDTPTIGINELTAHELALAPAFADIRQTVVTHVGLRPGAKADLVWRTEDTAPPPGGVAGGEIALRRAIPIDRFELRITVPSDVRLQHRCVDCDLEPVVSEAGDRLTYVWTAESLEPLNLFERHEHLGSLFDGLEGPRIVFSTAASWEDALRPLRPREEWENDPVVDARAERLAADAPTIGERLEAVQAFVAEAIATVPLPAGISPRPAAAPAETLRRGYGTPLDKAVLLAALLNRVGILAEAALARLHDDNYASDVPYAGQLPEAWVVAGSGEDERWLPVDRRGTSGGERAALGRVVCLRCDAAPRGPGGPPRDGDLADATVEVAIDADGAVAAEVRLVLAGLQNPYAALRAGGKDPAGRLEADAGALVPHGEATATVVETFSADRTAGTVELSGRLDSEGRGTWTLPLPWPGGSPFPDSLYRDSRDLPLRLPASPDRRVRWTIVLPEGWEPAIVPDSVRVDASSGYFAQEVVVAGGEVRIERSLELVRWIRPGKYDGLRELHRAFVTAGAEPLVLRLVEAP